MLWTAVSGGSSAEWEYPQLGPFAWLLHAVTATFGSLGSVVATSLLLDFIRRPELGRAMRPGRFSIADLMLFTAWLAGVLSVWRLVTEPGSAGLDHEALIASSVAIGMLLSALLRRLTRKGEPAERADEAFWRRHHEQLAAMTLEGESSAKRSP